MKVLSVIEALGFGGAETAMVDLISGLDEHRHSVWHFSGINGIPVNDAHVRRLHSQGAQVVNTHWATAWEKWLRDEQLARFQPDVVIFHWWIHEPWRPWLTERGPSGPAFVCVLHSARTNVSSGYDSYVLLAPFQAEGVPDARGARVQLIPNAVDLERYAVQSQAERSDDRAPLSIGILARLRPFKVPDSLVEDIVSWNVPGATWLIAGDGQLRPSLEADAARLGQQARVRFAGHVEREFVPAFLAGLDVLCHPVTPSVLDTNPIAVIEALAAGVPVVAERRGGLPALIEHERNGLLADSAEEMGVLLHRLAADRPLVRRLAVGARETSLRFGRARQLEAYRELLASLGPNMFSTTYALASD